MNGFNKFLASSFLSAAMLLPGVVQAMEIRQFDKMADQDQAEYNAARGVFPPTGANVLNALG